MRALETHNSGDGRSHGVEMWTRLSTEVSEPQARLCDAPWH